MLTKFASLEVGEILEVKGSRERITGAGLDKLSSYEDYRTDDGYLYTRVRAISSRVNKNHDGWPSEELAKSFLTFIGKPIFVDHNNSDPTKARGVIVDAKLHVEDDFEKAAALDPYYASAPENHKPPTWIELLLEVDAKQYPKLAKAIINDDIDGVSMGANVERSRCSHCDNWATTPEEYCTHVMQKGATFDKFDDFGRKTASPAYEDCYDIGFFEISYVFDPADATALDLGDKRHAISKVAGKNFFEAGGKKKIKPSVKNQQNKEMQQRQQEEKTQREFSDKQHKIKDRQYIYDRNRAYEDKPFLETPGENYQAPEHAPEGGALGIIGTPPLEGTGKETPYWKHPDKTPSDIKGPGETFTTVACPECLGGVNRADCPTCEGKGQIPAPKGELNVPPTVQPSPYRENAIEQAAQVPEDTRADRMKQKKRTQGSSEFDDEGNYQGRFDNEGICTKCGGDRRECRCDSGVTPREEEMYMTPHAGHDEYVWGCPDCKQQADTAGARYDAYEHRLMNEEMGKHAGSMDMGGYGNGQETGSPAPSPQLPDAQNQNCPTCGSAMENGVCPQCTKQAQQPSTQQSDSNDPSSGMIGAMSSFKIARDGHVVYSIGWDNERPIHETGIPAQPQQGSNKLYEEACLKARIRDLESQVRAQQSKMAANMDDPIQGDDTMDRLLNSPNYHDMAEFDESGNASDEEVAALLAQMETEGVSPDQKADRAVGMNTTLEGAIERLVQWGMSQEMAAAYAESAAGRRRRDQAEDWEVGTGVQEDDMPADPFLASFKIARDGAVHYAMSPEKALRQQKQDEMHAAFEAQNSPAIAQLKARIAELEAQLGVQKTAEQAPLPQSMMTTAPEGVDTLRQEKICEVCGSDMEDGKCEVCQYEEPPEGFDNPDLAKAQEIAEMGAMDAGGAPGGPPGAGGGEPPPGVMAPPGGAGGGGGAPGAGGGQPMAATRKSSETRAVTNERTAGTIRKNEQPILPATKTVSDHPKTTQVTKEPTRLVQSNTKETMKTIPTKAQVAAEMVRRGTFGVKTASEAEALLTEKGLDTFLADASPASDPAEHSQSVDQVGGEVDNAEGGVTHENLEKVQDIEAIPTMTWSDGKGDSLGQESPVTSEAGDLGGPIGDALASTKTADIFPGTDQADKQIDVNKPLQPEFTTGPDTMTWSGETGDSLPAAKPVTTEDSNMVGGPIGETLSRTQIVAHFFSAMKVAEQMVEQGLVNDEQKFELAAQLETETPEQLAVRRDMLSKTKTAGSRIQRTASTQPKLSRIVNSSREVGAQREVSDDNLGDAAIFGR